MTSVNAKFYEHKPSKSLWENICQEFSSKRKELEETEVKENASVSTDVTQFSSRRHTPLVCGHMVYQSTVDADVGLDFDPSIGHPALIGMSLLSRPEKPASPVPAPLPNPLTCNPTEYLETYVFPVLFPVIQSMLEEARKQKCFEKKRFGFNACDFLTKNLYTENHNLTPEEKEKRKDTSLFDIPFVAAWTMKHPREPLPLSLVWTDEEAAIKIQSYYRGHLVRIQPEVTELRRWQKEWREENEDIRRKVEEFWEEAELRATEGVSCPSSARSRKNSKKYKKIL